MGRPAVPAGGGRPSVEALEEERDFCLRSLRDLEAEHAAGDLDDADYETLRDSYVERAAAALRQLDGGESGVAAESTSHNGSVPAGLETAGCGEGFRAGTSEPGDITSDPPPRPPMRSSKQGGGGPRRRWVFVTAGVMVVAAAAAWGVVASSATRLPGQEITGQAVGSVAIARSLQAAQQAVDRGDALTAVKDYQNVLSKDPNQPQALTGEGWLLVQTQQPALLQQGLEMLSAAEQAAPTYGPARVYRGIALLSEDDYAGAIPELQWYLAHNPDPQLAPRVRAALQQAEARAVAGNR